MTQAPQRFDLRVTAPAERQLSRLPERVAAAIVEFMLGPLLDDPRRVGGPLQRELAGMRSARRGVYRIIDEIEEDARIVVVHHIDHRANAYRPR